MNDLPTVAIIGPGKVGTALGVLAVRAGYPVEAVGARRQDRAEAAARRIGQQVRACGLTEAAGAAKLVLLTVSDDAIQTTCTALAEREAFVRGAVVVHCSGALASDVLRAARDRCGCAVASMHPLQTLPSVEAAVAALPGTHCFCEGDESALELTERFAEDLGLKAVRIAAAGKLLYHAAAVLASNYLVALMDAALTLAGEAGVDRSTAWSALEPLVSATVRNIGRMGPAAALTGPVARGDVDTIRRHLRAIDSVDARLAALYRTVGGYVVDMAVAKGTITARTAGRIKGLLQEADASDS